MVARLSVSYVVMKISNISDEHHTALTACNELTSSSSLVTNPELSLSKCLMERDRGQQGQRDFQGQGIQDQNYSLDCFYDHVDVRILHMCRCLYSGIRLFKRYCGKVFLD